MKILHITHGFLDVGGLETFLPILINGMPEHHHFIAIWKNRRGMVHRKFNRLVELINLESLYDLKGIISELKPDLIHIHYTGPDSINDGGFLVDDGKYTNVIYKGGVEQNHDSHPFGYLYIHDILYDAEITKPPIMITCHSAFPMPLTVMFPHINCIVSVSNTAQEAQKGISTRHEVIYNGLDLEKFKPNPEMKMRQGNDKLQVLWVGALVKYDKDVYDLLKADEYINSKCDFYFLGSEGVLDNEPLPNYHFLGNVSDVSAYMQKCDIFLYPSRVDSFSYAVAEAMACGMIVIGSDAVSEVIGLGGLTYANPKHCLTTLRSFTFDTWQDKMDKATTPLEARIRALENFSSKTMIERYKEVYQKVILFEAAKWANPSMSR